MTRPRAVDVLVIGAGAAGMMCAIEAGRRGRSVLVVDHAEAPGEKIRISGGGRCNFTNLGTSPKNFLSQNPRFAISALARYTQRDFIALVDSHGIAWHEKTLGQLFCDGSARQIIAMLTDEMERAGVELRLATGVEDIARTEDGFAVRLSDRDIRCTSLVVASGGKSIPKMGATGLAYDIAARFGLAVVPPRPALVPLTFSADMLATLTPLAGIAVEEAVVGHGKTRFPEAVLFTHRGLSGPAVLQISSYWREGDDIVVSLAPGVNVLEGLKAARARNGRQAVQTVLAEILPRRLAQAVVTSQAPTGNLADCSDKVLARIDAAVNAWRIRPNGTEGWRTAEVTLGGIDTAGLDQQTMAAKSVPGLFFIGEAVDVTGWLGGYNFQWAWSSGWAAGKAA
ncbi:MAG: NAD(P)/FAD-dependent oxidoreductase [Phreatobacter sp.]|uniref:NAD(P)/FAD-dependent oxidoreductase n=1 Tax=Phreatobacter sp. TaxID=1966341 RepID=UPI0027336641|nr:NAD(P)/FAD-dependent oxidoreductase [Phreatobacter sp.]MDP2801531.1 NAD(P)/FAD-dependent oxidoreductase [Phreatobacter sp.]